MGWTFSHKSESETARQFLERNCLKWSTATPEAHPQVTAHSQVGTTHFFAVRFPLAYRLTVRDSFSDYVPALDGSVTVAIVFLTQSDRNHYNFGYKDMDESCGPNEVCGPRFLDNLSPLKDDAIGYAKNWRARVLAAHAAKASAPKITDGARIRFPEPMKFGTFEETEFTALTIPYRGRNTRVFRAASTGTLCRIDTKTLTRATVAA